MSDDISSEDDLDANPTEKKRRKLDLQTKESKLQTNPDKDLLKNEHRKENRKQKFLAIDAYSRHKMLVNQYLLNHQGATNIFNRDTSRDRTDADFIKINHKFLWSDSDEATSWGAKLAKRYYDKLFKEYCISDLSRYKEKKVAMRWRTEQEVITGKGQFICGDKKCTQKDDLASWEVNFGYVENGEKKNALVKLRLCPDCSNKLNYYHQKRKITKKSIKTEPLSETEGESASKIDEKLAEKVIKTEIQSPDREILESAAKNDEIWSKPVEMEEEKKREDEFEEFLEELLM